MSSRMQKSRKPYSRPQIKVMRINRFFFGACQIIWPDCYSQYLTLHGAPPLPLGWGNKPGFEPANRNNALHAPYTPSRPAP